MPTHPLARFFAIVLVLVYALGAFMPSGELGNWLRITFFGAMPVIAILLMWAAVRKSTPPLDDHAFHRTLPCSSGRAMARSLHWPLLSLAGCAMVLAWYCCYYHFSGESFLYGLYYLGSLAALMELCGLMFVVMSQRERGKTVVAVLIFGLPLASLYLAFKVTFNHSWVEWLIAMFGNADGAISVMAALIIYPLAWWLIVATRKSRLAAVVVVVFAAFFPWLRIPETWFNDPPAHALPWGAPVELVRALPSVDLKREYDPRRFPFEFKGLARGLVVNLRMHTSLSWGPSVGLLGSGKTGGTAVNREIVLPGAPSVSVDPSGNLVWGYAAQLNALEAALPAGLHLAPWSNDLRFWTERPVAVLGNSGNSTVNLDFAGEMAWEIEKNVYQYTDPIILSLAKGGSVSVPDGGRITLSPLADSNGPLEVTLDYRIDKPLKGPGIVSKEGRLDDLPVLVIVDDASGDAWWLSGSMESEFWDGVFLGRDFRFRYSLRSLAGEIHHPDEIVAFNKRLAALPQCRAFVFWRTFKGVSRQHLDAIEPSH